jgi:hypothetical protein
VSDEQRSRTGAMRNGRAVVVRRLDPACQKLQMYGELTEKRRLAAGATRSMIFLIENENQ